MKVKLTINAKKDIDFWVKNNLKIKKKIDTIIKDIILQYPNNLQGIGKPEKLKYWDNCYSRRITSEHRLVYKFTNQKILIILACSFHDK